MLCRFFPALWLFMLTASVIPVSMSAQVYDCDTAYAVERWSEPVRLPDRVNIPYGTKYFPSFAPDGKTLLYYSTHPAERIMQTTLTDTGWTEPILMPALKDVDLVRSTSFSSDGRSLYFVAWNGIEGWDIFRTDWDKGRRRWTEPVRLDTTVNSFATEWTVHITADGKELYFASDYPDIKGKFGGYDLFVSRWDSVKGKWGSRILLGKKINQYRRCREHASGVGTDDQQACTTQTGNKLYFSKAMEVPYNHELFVSYKDSAGNWTKAKRLNINSYADTSDRYPNGNWRGTTTGYDIHPAISPDGRTLIFASRRNTMIYNWPEELYISHLIVDEHGDSVKTDVPGIPENPAEPLKIELYPNPFSHVIDIAIGAYRQTDASITIYNSCGAQVRTIFDGTLTPGERNFQWAGIDDTGERLPRGLYFVVIISQNTSRIRPIIYY